jgi:hypothetical protein
MGGLEEWVGWLCMGGLGMDGFLPSSLCRSYEAKILQMKGGDRSENSPRFIFGFSRFSL